MATRITYSESWWYIPARKSEPEPKKPEDPPVWAIVVVVILVILGLGSLVGKAKGMDPEPPAITTRP